MFQVEVDRLLEYLLSIKKYKAPLHRSTHAVVFEKTSRIVMGLAILLFFAMLIFAGMVLLNENASEEVKSWGMAATVSSLVLVVASFVFNGVSIVISMLRLSKDAHADFLDETNKDFEHVRYALSVSAAASEYAEKILLNKITRIEGKISGFMGKNDLALLSLGAMAWTLYKEVDERVGVDYVMSQVSQVGSTSWLFNLAFFGFAFVFGMTLGAMALKYISRHYRYALEIVQLSHTLRKAGREKCRKHCAE